MSEITTNPGNTGPLRELNVRIKQDPKAKVPHESWQLTVHFYRQWPEQLDHERTRRGYASPADCLVSARHLVNELTKHIAEEAR